MKFFAAYFPAAYPNPALSLEYIRRSKKEGVDVFEIGYPAADPALDGECIGNAHRRVLAAGPPGIGYWKELRSAVAGPLWLMAYKRDFIDTGAYRDFARMGLAGVLVLPDCSEDERLAVRDEVAPLGVDVAGFANTRTPIEKFLTILKNYKLVYFQRYVGKTGAEKDAEGDPSQYLKLAASCPGRALFAGFGIKSAEKAGQLLRAGFDGVVIGTAILEALETSDAAMYAFIRGVAEAVRSAARDAELDGASCMG